MKLPPSRSGWIVITVLVAAFGGAWIGLTRVQAGEANPNGRPPSPNIGHPAPDFTLPALSGESLSLSDLRGRPVVLNFWATWCGPCRVEIPALEAASQAAGSQGVILGVNVQEDPERVMAFAAELGITYPIVLDASAEVARLYRVNGFPTTYFIDPQGVVAGVFHGPLNAPLLETRLMELSAPTR